MSINTKKQLPCPHCDQMNNVTVWNSITADDSPDLKSDLLHGKINFYVCGNCGCRALMPDPMLYHDNAKKLIMSFSPCADEERAERLYEKMAESSEQSGEMKKLEGYNLRFVTDINDLMEKILIFDNGLNDKVIEVIKIMVLSQDLEKADQRTCRFGKKDEENIEFMIKDNKEDMLYTCKVPTETYNTLYKQIMQSGVKPYSFNWEFVNKHYASRILNGFNNNLR